MIGLVQLQRRQALSPITYFRRTNPQAHRKVDRNGF